MGPAVVVVATLSAAEPPLAVALTMPYAPPPTAMAAAARAIGLLALRENMS
jgi:hypothetical protein